MLHTAKEGKTLLAMPFWPGEIMPSWPKFGSQSAVEWKEKPKKTLGFIVSAEASMQTRQENQNEMKMSTVVLKHASIFPSGPVLLSLLICKSVCYGRPTLASSFPDSRGDRKKLLEFMFSGKARFVVSGPCSYQFWLSLGQLTSWSI